MESPSDLRAGESRERSSDEQQGLRLVEAPAPADPQTPSRRFVIRLATTAAALGYAAPTMARASGAAGGMSGAPVNLPYSYTLMLSNETATLTAPGMSAVYLVSGSGHIDIDVNGNVTLSAINVQGTHSSGANVGPITIAQTGPATPPGSYTGTSVLATANTLYSDASLQNVPGVFQLSGAIFQGGCNLHLENDWPVVPGQDGDGITIWSKATC